jgi:hypothetical protein
MDLMNCTESRQADGLAKWLLGQKDGLYCTVLYWRFLRSSWYVVCTRIRPLFTTVIHLQGFLTASTFWTWASRARIF